MNSKYKNILEVVNDDILKVKAELVKGIDVSEPLREKLLDFLNSPSKHIRPLVSFLYLKALGLEIDDNQIIFQSVVELVHNASLIHDDIIDESSVRRGKKSLNAESGNKISVILGDYILSIALKKLLNFGNAELIDMFARTLKQMSEGEIEQQIYKFKIPPISNYLEKTGKKTAELFVTAVCGSMLLAEKTGGEDFSYNFGMAFQIRDDLINAKTTKTDIKEGIYTAPVIFSGGVENIEYGIEKTRDLLNNYVEKAYKAIENVSNSKYKLALGELLELIRHE